MGQAVLSCPSSARLLRPVRINFLIKNTIYLRLFFLFFFLFNPCGLKNRYRSLRTEARKALPCFNPLFLLWGKSPETPQCPLTLESVQSSEVNDPLRRKATASKHSRFTLVCFALFASRKMWLGGEQCVFDSLSCVPALVGTDELSRLCPLCDRPLILCPSSALKVRRSREDMSVLRAWA